MKSIAHKEITKISLYFVFVLLFGALIAPALFNLGKGVAGMRIVSEDGYLHKVLSGSDFKRYFNRAMLVAALIGLVPLFRSLKIRRADLGMLPNPRWKSHLLVGFVAAAGLLLLMGSGYIVFNIFDLAPPERHRAAAEWGSRFDMGTIFGIVSAAIAVPLLEEFFFRGAILGLALRTVKPLGALLFVTFFFTIVHFLKPPDSTVIADADVNWGSGFWMVGQIFSKFGNPVFILSQFATLFAVGWILGVARLRTDSLWLSIGLHGGWVFGLKFYSELTWIPVKLQKGAYLPWAGRDLKEGLVPLAFVILTGIIVFAWLRRSASRPLDSELIAAG
ncbi:MAG: CPBP family intramembrane glutamic endopeptidase [Verrucomicrobiales bacterium]